MIYDKISALASKGFRISIYFYTRENLADNFSKVSKLTSVSKIVMEKSFIQSISGNFVCADNSNLGCKLVELGDYISKKPKFSLSEGFSGTMLSNIGDFAHLDKFGKEALLCGDIGLNIYNTQSAKFYCDIAKTSGCNLHSVTVSPEISVDLQLDVAKKLIESNLTQPEIIAYGRLPVMKCEHCVVSGIAEPVYPGNDREKPAIKCENCKAKGIFYLKDEKGLEFPVIPVPKYCQSIIFSAKTLDYTDYLLNTELFGKEKPILRFNIFDEEL